MTVVQPVDRGLSSHLHDREDRDVGRGLQIGESGWKTRAAKIRGSRVANGESSEYISIMWNFYCHERKKKWLKGTFKIEETTMENKITMDKL